MLLASDGITIGEKWTTVLPSEIDVDFFYSVHSSSIQYDLCSSVPYVNVLYSLGFTENEISLHHSFDRT